MDGAESDASTTRVKRRRHLLVWDAPNMDMTLSTVLGGRPTPDTRPSLLAMGRWLTDRAGADDAEAAVFTNIVPEAVARVLPWVTAVRSAGFALFAKPKIEADDDIDDDLADGGAGGIVDDGRGRFFEHFLVATLQRAVALAEVDHIAMAIGDDLNLDVPGLLEIFLHVDGIVAERRLRFSASRRERDLQLFS